MTETTTAIDLVAIGARAEEASPGPWRKSSGITYVHDANGDVVASIAYHHDWDFVAHARTDIPDLLAEVVRLRGELQTAHRDRQLTAIENRGLIAETFGLERESDTVSALADVLIERARQDARWGAGSADKNPDGTGPHTRPLYAHTATGIADDDEAHYIRDVLQGRVDWRAANDGTADRPLTHADIFLEEVAEALAEDDPAKLRAELVQAAAYAVKWIEAIDRRTAATDA